MRTLELLAPARNTDIGIAAIDCGADAVYIAGPAFGARAGAGNSPEEIGRLCGYAHRFGAKVFVTVNTIIYDREIPQVDALLQEIKKAGADALIVQDLGLLKLPAARAFPLHASTQCAIRDTEKAAWMEALGFSRIVPERQLGLNEIRRIASAVSCETECFIHGALCVCYSGQCYLSEYIGGRSANRGECMQACRSRYDLIDAEGKVLVRDKALLSLKDLKLEEELEDLALAGVCSFKIEGRLKNMSYVKNTVRRYSMALDKLVSRHPGEFRRSSCGHSVCGFTPDTAKTFNRGYTSLFFDGKKKRGLSSSALPGGSGEKVGEVLLAESMGRDKLKLTIKTGLSLSNGDGFVFEGAGDTGGFRGDVCRLCGIDKLGLKSYAIQCKQVSGLGRGSVLYRNRDSEFERSLEAGNCMRLLGVQLSLKASAAGEESWAAELQGLREDGSRAQIREVFSAPKALNPERMSEMLHKQLSKKAMHFSFTLSDIHAPEGLPLLAAAQINSLRRKLALALDKQPCQGAKLYHSAGTQSTAPPPAHEGYKANISNALARQVFKERGQDDTEDAYELSHREDAELMRSRYCIKYELGLCPQRQGAAQTGPLFLRNNGRLFSLGFDCKSCEMTVSAGPAA